MPAPAVNVQTSIANSLPIIKATMATLAEITTPITLANHQEIGYRAQMVQMLATCSKTGYPSALAAAIVPATVDPLIAAAVAAQTAHDEAKTNDDFVSTLADLVVAQEAVVTYYTTVFSALP